ncbi:MAG: hypothetical protein LW809_04575 [Vampirovibrionales bacterium]|nr:hypothetical protein [Vampirovibrionales bacterium]
MTDLHHAVWDDPTQNNLITPESPQALARQGHVRESGLCIRMESAIFFITS